MKKIICILFLVVMGIVFYGATLRGPVGNYTTVSDLKRIEGYTGSPFESSHERASYAELVQMREKNTPALSDGLRDFAAPDVGFDNEKYYSYFPPGISLIIRPLFELGYPFHLSLVAAYSTMAIISIGTMIMLYLICKNVFELPSYIGILAALTFAFATTSWSYAVTIFQHAPSAFFAAVMFYGVARYRARVKTSAIWASIVWFTYGISILFDYPNGLILAPFIVYYLSSAFQIIRAENEEHKISLRVNMAHFAVVIWFVIGVAIQLTFNALYMDHAFELRQNFARYDPGLARLMLEQDIKNKVMTVTSENVSASVEQRTHMPFLEEVFFSGIVTLLVAPDKGLFYFSPILIFALWGIYYAFKYEYKLEHAILVAFMVTNLFIYASFGDPHGGWAFGPRYLIPAMVALGFYTAYGYSKLKHPLFKALFFFIFLFSMCISAAGVLTTNNVPPHIEADFLKKPFYNYLLNFHMIDTQGTSNFVYTTFLKNSMRLSDYYVLIVISLGLITYMLLFVIPLLFKRKK